ncbi:hypothetical protein HJFPF1_00836 [Paramyrothecium foliicola]|nr:hypothetical protein HJFPF1_00836 [Paramyrothecium foliicola]
MSRIDLASPTTEPSTGNGCPFDIESGFTMQSATFRVAVNGIFQALVSGVSRGLANFSLEDEAIHIA